MADANDLPNYDALLAAHQTPQSLIDAIKGVAPNSLPGGQSQREEHSAQNLLALIIERKTGLPFRQAMQQEVFEPFGMRDSGIDDDGPISGPLASGNQVSGTLGLKPAPAIHWSAKAGNGSAYSTVLDYRKWFDEIMHGNQLSQRSRDAIFNATQGYGWDARTQSKRLGTEIDIIGGRCCGFSSFLLYIPNRDLCIVAMTNIEHDANPAIIQYLAAMMLKKPYPLFAYDPMRQPGVDGPEDFTFGKDFYRPSATLRLVPDANGLNLQWPDHPYAGLVPTGKDQFMDRYYWSKVTIVRDADGKPVGLDYGPYHGTLTPPRP